MTCETRNITFHVIHVKVSSDCQCSRTLPMSIAIESAHCDCERNKCRLGKTWSTIWGKKIWMWLKVEDCMDSIDTQNPKLVRGEMVNLMFDVTIQDLKILQQKTKQTMAKLGQWHNEIMQIQSTTLKIGVSMFTIISTWPCTRVTSRATSSTHTHTLHLSTLS